MPDEIPATQIPAYPHQNTPRTMPSGCRAMDSIVSGHGDGEPFPSHRADLDGDWEITPLDLVRLRKLLVGEASLAS